MRIFLAMMLLAGAAFGQAPKAPEQGPPPKNLVKQPDGHVSANGAPANPEKYETHVVQAGETLSQIAESVLKDSRLWPQLWETNEHIVNPHWIYPGDPILIHPITKITEAVPPAAPEPPPPPAAAEPETAPAPPPVPASRGIAVIRNLIGPSPDASKVQDVYALPSALPVPAIKDSDIYCSGFVRSTPIPSPIKVMSTYQRSGAVLSTDSQYVHLSKGSNGGVKSGAVFQVVRPTRTVRDSSRPGTAGNLGTHYLDIGQIQVVQVMADSALARVIGNCEAVEVGDAMIPFVHYDLPELPPNRTFSDTMTTSGAVKGAVVFMRNSVASAGSTYRTSAAFPSKGSIVAEGGVVYINLGKGDGVKSGDLFIVYHGKYAIGEIAVLKVDDKSSSALVTYSTSALVLGDRVERR